MKLCDLYPLLDAEERDDLRKALDIAPGYLWQLATQWRGKKPSIDLLVKMAAADKRLTVEDLVAEFATAQEA